MNKIRFQIIDRLGNVKDIYCDAIEAWGNEIHLITYTGKMKLVTERYVLTQNDSNRYSIAPVYILDSVSR